MTMTRIKVRFDPGTDDVTGIAQAIQGMGVRGIGEKLSLKIAQAFRRYSFDVLTNPDYVCRKVEGIGRKRAEQLCYSVNRKFGNELSRKQRDENRQKMQTEAFFGSLGLHGWILREIFTKYGAKAKEVITDNPYRLTEVSGIGFKRADEVAKALGITGSDARRISAGLIYTLEYATTNGHCCLPAELLTAKAAETLGVSVGDIEAVLKEMTTMLDDDSEEEQLVMSMGAVYLKKYLLAEDSVAASLKYMLSRPDYSHLRDQSSMIVSSVTRYSHVHYNNQQAAAIRMALDSSVMILTGGPGTGKTTTLRGILEALEIVGVKYMMCAPTGRAAKRMSETTGGEAKTIHRLLDYHPDTGFGMNKENPLGRGVVIVDEASMVDLMLMRHLLDALSDRNRLILIGDNDQLPSVGAGRVLGDLIDSGAVPTIRLTEVYRQAEGSHIVENAHRIIEGKMPVICNRTSKDFFFVSHKTDEEVVKTVVSLVETRIPNAYGKKEIQVLCPRKAGETATENMNKVLRDALNPCREGSLPDDRFRENDRVMQTKNNYAKNVFNGDIGVVKTGGMCPSVLFDGQEEEIMYEPEELGQLMLAYAITIHKSQGSEYDVVVIPLMKSAGIMLQRNLLYTAVTRAKEMCIIVGDWDAIRMSVGNWLMEPRHTRLKERMQLQR